MINILFNLAKEYDSKIGVSKAPACPTVFPIKSVPTNVTIPSLITGYVRSYDVAIYEACIIKYFTKLYPEINVIGYTKKSENKSSTIIDLVNNKPNLNTFKNAIVQYKIGGVYPKCKSYEFIYFPFGKLLGLPLLHLMDISNNETATKYGNDENIITESKYYNIAYRELCECDDFHCFDCMYSNKLGVDVKLHPQKTLNEYVNELFIHPMIKKDILDIKRLDLDPSEWLSKYFDPKIIGNNFDDVTEFDPDITPFIDAKLIDSYDEFKFESQIPIKFSRANLKLEEKLTYKFFENQKDIFIHGFDSVNTPEETLASILESGKKKFCVKLRPTQDFKFFDDVKIFLSPFACNIDCHDINFYGDVTNKMRSYSIEKIISFKNYLNFVDRNFRYFSYKEEAECYDCIFCKYLGVNPPVTNTYHDVLPNVLPIVKLPIIIEML